jgi:hypothetical protein
LQATGVVLAGWLMDEPHPHTLDVTAPTQTPAWHKPSVQGFPVEESTASSSH